jgi:hypothetical protein
VFVFVFINSFGSLFYIGLIREYFEADPCPVSAENPHGGCLWDLSKALGTIFIMRLVVGNAQEVLMPYVKHRLARRKTEGRLRQAKEAKEAREAEEAGGGGAADKAEPFGGGGGGGGGEKDKAAASKAIVAAPGVGGGKQDGGGDGGDGATPHLTPVQAQFTLNKYVGRQTASTSWARTALCSAVRSANRRVDRRLAPRQRTMHRSAHARPTDRPTDRSSERASERRGNAALATAQQAREARVARHALFHARAKHSPPPAARCPPRPCPCPLPPSQVRRAGAVPRLRRNGKRPLLSALWALAPVTAPRWCCSGSSPPPPPPPNPNCNRRF